MVAESAWLAFYRRLCQGRFAERLLRIHTAEGVEMAEETQAPEEPTIPELPASPTLEQVADLVGQLRQSVLDLQLRVNPNTMDEKELEAVKKYFRLRGRGTACTGGSCMVCGGSCMVCGGSCMVCGGSCMVCGMGSDDEGQTSPAGDRRFAMLGQ
jgi:hypothetical protein